MTFLDELENELAQLRIPAARRRMLISELDDRFARDPHSLEQLGEPASIARRFADELGTALARHAVVALFAALVPFGLLFTAGLAASDPNLVGPTVILGTQIAFVGCMLGLLRTWRLRHETTVPNAEANVVLRRTALGLAGGLLTLAGVLAAATDTPTGVAAWFEPLAYAMAAVGAITLIAATVILVQALRLRPAAPGHATGDLVSDLGPFVPGRLRGDPWRLALSIAALVAACIAIAGIAQGDPFDGLARALADATACIAGFALLGRPLGLRH